MKNLFTKKLSSFFKGFSAKESDPRYVFLLIFSVPILLLTTIQALNKGWFDSFERPLFHAVNSLPHFLNTPMLIFTQLGSLGSIFIWVGVAWYLVNKRCAVVVASSGALAWVAAKALKTYVHRGRPQDLLRSIDIIHSHHFSGFGFPSGHATFSAACATALYYQVSPKYRKFILWAVFLVGISRMYLGAHFPLDVLGGWTLGITVASILSLIVGNSRSSVRASFIRKVLRRRGYELDTVRFLQLDARGSRPLYIKDKNGNEFFAKLFGSQEHAADWLFKLYRLFRYKNLNAEEPYFNGRRNVEVESFANLWAKKGGVRVPEIIDLIKAGRYWLIVQEKIDAIQLDEPKRISEKALVDAWRQVQKLHSIPIAHRDLRAANIMLDKSAKAWIIDFGFAETSPSLQRINMDNAELLMSMSLIVGVKRTASAATKVLDNSQLKSALPYLQKSVFSGATRQQLKKNKHALPDLVEEIKGLVNHKGEVQTASIDRLNAKRLVNIFLLAFFLYIILPQFRQFRGTFDSVESIRYAWLIIVTVFSMLTYLAAGSVYVALADVPIKIRDSMLVQLAASFMSKMLPGGLGSASLTVRYLVNSGMDAAQASVVILAQTAIGIIMFIVPLLLFVVINGQGVGDVLPKHINSKIIILVAGLIGVFLVSIGVSKKLRKKISEFVQKALAQLQELSTSPRELSLAALSSFFITVFYIACLYSSAHAIHVNISITQTILAYAVAVVAKSSIPTPGGLGPLEVALVASLVSFGVDHNHAIAATIVYRLATFWLPIPFSFLAYRYILTKKLI